MAARYFWYEASFWRLGSLGLQRSDDGYHWSEPLDREGMHYVLSDERFMSEKTKLSLRDFMRLATRLVERQYPWGPNGPRYESDWDDEEGNATT